MHQQKAKELDLELIKKWLQETFPDLQGAYLFGSYASGYARYDSDVDLAILIPRKLNTNKLWEQAIELGCKVGLDVEIINLLNIETVFQNEIIKSGKRILTINKGACDLFEVTVYSQYLYFNESRKEIVENFINDRIKK
jgi:uncharacterized protein